MHTSSQSRSTHSFALVFAAALLGLACAGPEAAEPSPEALAVEALTSGGAGHPMPLTDGKVTSAQSYHLDYYGGRVLDHAEAVAVLWGSGVAPAVASGIGPFYAAALKSSYVDWLTEYDTDITAVDGKPGTGQKLARGTFKGLFTIKPSSSSKSLTDAAIRAELTAQITAKKLPAPTAQTVYLISLPPGVTVSMGGSSSCTSGGFCGYHNSYTRAGKEVDYAVLPDLGPGSGCETGCGKGSSAFANQTSVASHELIESITDPQVGLATVLGRPLAWYDTQGGEIGDICVGQQGTLKAAGGKTYTVQKEWSNLAKACITAKSKSGAGTDEAEEDDGQ
jgi:hypothetical protein